MSIIHEVLNHVVICSKKMAVNSHTELEQSNLTLNLSRKEEHLPFVFQCKGCNNILGDSSAFTSSDQELEVICLNGKCRKCGHRAIY